MSVRMPPFTNWFLLVIHPGVPPFTTHSNHVNGHSDRKVRGSIPNVCGLTVGILSHYILLLNEQYLYSLPVTLDKSLLIYSQWENQVAFVKH